MSQLSSPVGLNVLGGHTLQCVAPVRTPSPPVSPADVVVKLPGWQTAQWPPAASLYVPSGHSS